MSEDNEPGETITAAFRKKYGIGDTGKLPLPPSDHPMAYKFARAILSRAHQVQGVDPAEVAARVKRAKAIVAAHGKKSATERLIPWRNVTWVDLSRPLGEGAFQVVRPGVDELPRAFLARIPHAMAIEQATKLSESQRDAYLARPVARMLCESANGFGQPILEQLGALPDPARAADLSIIRDTLMLRAGPGNLRDRNWYKPECIRRSLSAFEGARSFYDHPGPGEEREQPGGSVKNMAGWFSNVRAKEYNDPKIGKTVGMFGDFHPALGDERVLMILRTCHEYAKRYPTEAFAGLSIRAYGEGAPGHINGEPWNLIDEITQVESVDIVTRAGAGGTFLPVGVS